jgi:quinol monooxygenase YgiN
LNIRKQLKEARDMKAEARYAGTKKPDVFSMSGSQDTKIQRQMVRVVIQHKTNDVEGLLNILKEIRDEIFKFPGYVTTEHLIDVKNPTNLLVISTWQNAERWNAWANSEICKKLTERVKAKLTRPLKITVYNYFVIREKRVWSTF